MKAPITNALFLHGAIVEENPPVDSGPCFDAYRVKLYAESARDAAEVYVVMGAEARELFRSVWTVCASALNTRSYRHPAPPPEAPAWPENAPQFDARQTWQTHRLVCLECKTATCVRGHKLLFEYARTLTPAPTAAPKSPFWQHLDECAHCRANVHNLCPGGEAALTADAAAREARSRDAADAAARVYLRRRRL